MKKGYHDYSPLFNVEKKPAKIYTKNCNSLILLKKPPKKPIGYLRSLDSIIQTTDEKGIINVDSFVLMFGRQAPKLGPISIYTNPITSQASKIFD